MLVALPLLLLQVALATGSAYNALLTELFAGYNTNGRPIDNASYPTLVRMAVEVMNLIELVRQIESFDCLLVRIYRTMPPRH